MTKKPEGRLDQVEKLLAQLAKSDVAFNKRLDRMAKANEERDRRSAKSHAEFEKRLDSIAKRNEELDRRLTKRHEELDRRLTKRHEELDRRLTKRDEELDRRLTKRHEALDLRSAKNHAEFEQSRKEQRRAIDTLLKMTANADGRMNGFDAKFAELADVVLTVAKSTQDIRAILKKVSEAQQRTDAALARIAETQANRGLEHDDLKEKLHLLYDIVDN